MNGEPLPLPVTLSPNAGLHAQPALVVAIDLAPPEITLPENVTFIGGDSIAPATVTEVGDYCRNRRTMVMVDGNHAAEHALHYASTAPRFPRM